MLKRLLTFSILTLALALAGCTDGPAKDQEKSPAKAKTPPSKELLDPSLATEQAPDLYRARLTTTKGDIVIEVDRSWSPRGADRFYNLVKIGFFEDVAFFRVVKDFMVQFGIHGNPAVAKAWTTAPFADDRVLKSNRKGYVTFARTGMPNSRATQIFINYKDNPNLDPPAQAGFSPFGKVVEGMDVVNALYGGYGEMKGMPQGDNGVDVAQLMAQGNDYLSNQFPLLDRIVSAQIEKD
ncbi:MAG: peptidylprolyl isomerase [Planctomycetes bacterium]|nr:peptidylprolyl isomerase [Planctomycetota bacterium]